MATEKKTPQKGSTRDALDEVNFKNDAIRHTKSLNDEKERLKLKELMGRKKASGQSSAKKISGLQGLQGLNTQSLTPFK